MWGCADGFNNYPLHHSLVANGVLGGRNMARKL
jgi:hypothetical protein